MGIKAIFIPGYHGVGEDILSAKHQMWFAWLKEELEKLGMEVIAKDYPDAYLCRANYWLPFIKKLGADENTILVGHSTDDPWISNDEAHMVHEMLTSELHEFHNQGHFGADRPKMEFPELLEVIKQKLNII